MDAITHAALDNLHRSALPRLQNALALIYLIPAAERAASAEVREMLAECSDLITMISQWASLGSEGVDLASETSTDPTMTADVIDRSLAANGPLELDGSGFNGDIPGLDDPVDLGTYGEFAPEPPPTISAHSSVAADISDDEAMALLAAMDAPLNTANHETINDTINDTNEGVSDDEALRLLAEMDAPASPPPATLLKSAPPVTTSAKTSRASAPPASSSADDEALALLAAMGGMDEQPSPASHASEGPTSAQEGPSTEAGGLDTTGIEEIPEWENNDFASDPEMMTDFTQNTGEIMQTLDDNVLRLEQNPTDKETIEEIFRAAHTLKGAAGMFGFKSIERVMHRMENLFDLVRKGKLVPKSDTIDVVFLGLDVLKKLLAAVLAGKPSGIKTAPTVRMLELAAEGKPTGMKRTAGEASPAGRIKALVTASPSAAPVGPAASASQSGDDHAATSGSGTKKKSEAATTIRVDLERLDALVNLVGELVIDRTRFVNIEESLRIQAPQLKLASNMTETLQQFGRHMNEIQEIIMKVRMVPVGSVFNKYPRIVRDLARQLGKQIELVIDGEETEFDKTLVEQIADPLVHLIRNACDHGVEMPAERQAGGKTPNGSVTLSARQEGNQIIIQITDDGKGMDVNRIRSKAIE
ncbi:MAG: Hpt domain-containing protein, partial [Proteobacteria bacterium]|nr:Hpt domain-containing protein [Pseudomonadota bacterium]